MIISSCLVSCSSRMATLACMVVLVIGNTLGAVVKGITGFGSAIINLCVWVVCVSFGIDGGTLQQAVVSECVCSEFCALPLLGLTKAGKTCDWCLVLALLCSGAAGAPIGAFLLTGLPARLVEFVMACALLLVICLHCNAGQHVKDWLHNRGAHSASCSSKDGVGHQTSSNPATPYQRASGAVQHQELSQAVCIEPSTAARTHLPVALQPVRCQAVAAFGEQPAAVVLAVDGTRATDSAGVAASKGSDQEAAPLLQQQQQLSADTVNSIYGDNSSMNSSSRGCLQPWRNAWSQGLQSEQRQAAARIFLAGSLAGSIGGVMQGMTGMGGPPLMYMYDKLQVGKDTVRGCNAVLNVLQVRVIAYALAGVFTLEDLWLYVAVSVTGLLGLCLGNCLAGMMNQQVFSKVMVLLMCLCCGLMFASSAGFTDQQEQR